MAIENFIPKVWDASLIQNFYNSSKIAAVTFKPEKIEGDTVIYNTVSDIAIKDYAGKVVFDELATNKVELIMNQKKYWAFKVNDVDAIQAAGPLTSPHVMEASNKMAQLVDTYAFKDMVDNCLEDNVVEITDALSPENAYDGLVALNRTLDKNRVGQADRFLVIDWDYLSMLEKDVRFTYNYKVLENGVIEGSTVNGATLVVSNDLPAGRIIAMHKSAYGFGMQLNETEALRLQDDFADGVRGLQVYGGKLIRSKALATLEYAPVGA